MERLPAGFLNEFKSRGFENQLVSIAAPGPFFVQGETAWMKEWEIEGDDDDMPDISGGPSSLVYLVG